MKYGASIIILYDSEHKLLLQHRTKDAKIMPDYWAFFGGGLKHGETSEEAVYRETFEELNYKLKSPKLVLEQDFVEGNLEGHLYIYVELFEKKKSSLKLLEGQGWGWYNKSEICNLKMTKRDQQIIEFIIHYLERE